MQSFSTRFIDHHRQQLSIIQVWPGCGLFTLKIKEQVTNGNYSGQLGFEISKVKLKKVKRLKVKVYSLVSNVARLIPIYPLVTGPVHSTISTPWGAYRTSSQSAHQFYFPHTYSPSQSYQVPVSVLGRESAIMDKVPCPRTQRHCQPGANSGPLDPRVPCVTARPRCSILLATRPLLQQRLVTE